MIGLIGAMELEIRLLLDRMENRTEECEGMERFYCGTLCGVPAVLAVCGPGKVNAALCAQSMILRYRPEWVLNLGIAGSAEDGIAIGDMVIATAAVQHDVDTSAVGDPIGYVSRVGLVEFPCDAQLRGRLRSACEQAGFKVYEGVVASGDQFLQRGETRSAIHTRFGCKAIEMEGAAIAHACLIHGVPCGILRSISDQANESSEKDYGKSASLAAAHSQQVVSILLSEVSS